MSQFHVRVSSRTLYERSPSSVCFIPAVQLRATIEVLSNDRLGLHFDCSQLRWAEGASYSCLNGSLKFNQLVPMLMVDR